jgi:hypothetical protein
MESQVFECVLPESSSLRWQKSRFYFGREKALEQRVSKGQPRKLSAPMSIAPVQVVVLWQASVDGFVGRQCDFVFEKWTVLFIDELRVALLGISAE